MPELPEVETTMRALGARLQGLTITDVVQRRADLRFPLPNNLVPELRQRRIVGFRRRAKYILADCDRNLTMLLHLGMSGRLVFDGPPMTNHEHLTFHFDDRTTLRYVDPRRFGMLDLTPTLDVGDHRWLRHLGVEPLGPSFDGAVLRRQIGKSRSSIKAAVLDQRRIVGVGNIYACESLHRASISPVREACSLSIGDAGRLADAIRAVLWAAIDAGGSSLRDYVQANGELGNFQSMFQVYGRVGEPCTRCGNPIERMVQSNRATFHCPQCQR